MMRSLFTKTLYDKRWFILGWAAIMFIMVFLVMLFYPSFKQGGFDQLSGSVPPALKGLIGDQASFNTISGFIGTQLYDIRIPLMLMIMALILGQSMTVGEEEKGTLRTLLTVPLSRSRILWERWAAATTIVGIAVFATAVGAFIGAWVINVAPPSDLIWRLAVLSWLFGTTALSIPYAIGAATGSRGLTMTVGLLITIGSFLLTTFGRAVDWLQDWDRLSLMHYYDTHSLVQGSFNRGDMWILLSLMLLALCIATLLFRHRDVS